MYQGERRFDDHMSEMGMMESKKTEYFSKLALEVKTAFRLHQTEGLLEKNQEGVREWGNVSEHCLVEVARVKVLAKRLGLDDEIICKLEMAAALHDFFKKSEKSYMERGGLKWGSYSQAGAESRRILSERGFGQDIIELANSVGHESLVSAEGLIRKEQLSDYDKAFLIMHYVDDYTIGSEWSNPASDGKNDLDRRMEKNELNPRCQVINQEGIGKFNEGETTYQAQLRVGKEVERRIAELLSENLSEVVDPVDLPCVIDQQIREEILAS